MEIVKVAVTAAGGGIGQSIIKALQGTEYKTIAIDPRSDAAGLWMAHKGVLGRDVNDPLYIDRLLEICKKENCKFLFPGLDAELMPISLMSGKFFDIGTTPIISDPQVVTLSDDKWALYEFLCNNRFPRIESALSIDEAKAKGIKFPWILKPKSGGCRSKNVFQCNKESEVKCLLDSGEEYIIQEFIDGDEYTCGTVTFEKQVLGTIQMRRTLRNGDTYKAFVEGVPSITILLEKLLPKLDPFGPCNVQLRMRGNVPYILEINARCSGTTAARALAGFNEPLMICNHLLNKKVSHDIKDVAIFRYWNEIVVDKREKEHLERENTTHGI